MKMADPTIDEVRQARHQISEAAAHDSRKLVEYYRKLQERHRERLVKEPTSATEKGVDDAA
jgi:hypothetical protein